MNDELSGVLEQAARKAEGWYNLSWRIKDAGGDGPLADQAAAIAVAFEYDLTEPGETERRARWGPFAPMLELAEGRVYPLPLSEMHEETLLAWESTLDSARHPSLRARLADLLWERKRSERPDLHARAAIDAYREVARGSWTPLYRAECLIRGLELARAVADEPRRADVASDLIAAARESMEQGPGQPGVALRLIRALADLPDSGRLVEVDELLSQASHVYSQDTWIMQSVSDLQATRAPAERDDIYRAQVERWRAEARRADNGIAKMAHLQSGLELARLYGLNDLAEELRRDLQSVTPEEMDLQEVSASIEISREEIERFHNYFLEGDGWRECLERFGAYGPPSGDHQDNLKLIKELERDHPLQFLISRVVFAKDGSPLRRATTPEEHRDLELIAQETRAIGFWALSAQEVLERIRNEKGVPPLDEMKEFFTAPLIPAILAGRIGGAVLRYWADDFDIAGHLLVPRLETVIRGLALRAGLAVIREPIDGKPGGVRPLGSVLGSLEGRMDESWRRHLVNLLVEPAGTNLRNRIAHGLIDAVSNRDTALLIHAACFLRLLAVTSQGES